MGALGVYVAKADGSRQLFDREKVIRTCLRMSASRNLAFEVAEKVEARVYEGMSTEKVLRLIFRFMRRQKPGIGDLFDLRKGLSLMSSRPEFEVFVQELLRRHGFEVSGNQILKGRCVEHEVDAVARKGGVTYFVEAKHHVSYHSLTGLDESRIARAVLEDVSEGYERGVADFGVDRAIIVTNTRFSDFAIRYGRCRDIMQVGWNYPVNLGLEDMIEEKRLHPLSCVRGLHDVDRLLLVDCGVVLIRQLLAENQRELVRKTGLRLESVREIVEKVRFAARALEYS